MSIVKLNNRGVRSASTFGSISALGEMRFIKKLTASSSATLSFVDGSSDVVLDNTYKEYLFTFNNIHPATNGVFFTVGFRDGSTDYDATKTTTYFRAYHDEADSATSLEYTAGSDLAQGTGFQYLSDDLGNDNDQSCSGYLHLFNPSSTTFVKHFIANLNTYHQSDYSVNSYVAGYCNVTAAIDAVQFKMSTGNIDAGDICLYGIN
jgi:hypothetical protein